MTARTSFRTLLVAVTATLVGFGGATALGQQGTVRPGTSGGEIEVVPVRGNVYLVAGAGGNICASVGRKDGILLVDSGLASKADQTRAALQGLANRLGVTKPIRYIINTDADPDHTGGNAALSVAGRTFSGGNVIGDLPSVTEDAAVIAHENVLVRLSAGATEGTVLTKGLPTETYYRDTMKLSHFFNDEGVVVIHQPAAHTDGDSLVYFRGSDVLCAGDLFSMTNYPVIDLERGGSVQGVLAGLNRMLDLIVPEFRTEGGTFVVPGHGRIGDMADVAYYRDMVTIIRDRVQNMIGKRMTLAQIKAARPTEDWDPRLGANPAWTPDMFVEAVYFSLVKQEERR